jgi:hypothetical protein
MRRVEEKAERQRRPISNLLRNLITDAVNDGHDGMLRHDGSPSCRATGRNTPCRRPSRAVTYGAPVEAAAVEPSFPFLGPAARTKLLPAGRKRFLILHKQQSQFALGRKITLADVLIVAAHKQRRSGLGQCEAILRRLQVTAHFAIRIDMIRPPGGGGQHCSRQQKRVRCGNSVRKRIFRCCCVPDATKFPACCC